MQVPARKGRTGVPIGGVWLVYVNGPKRWTTIRFDAFDGNNQLRTGAWNYQGRFSSDLRAAGDVADLYSPGDDPIRYPINPSTFVGLPWGGTNGARFGGHFRMVDGRQPHLSQGSCGMAPVYVQFHPRPFNPNP